jgi:hypothetical protein
MFQEIAEDRLRERMADGGYRMYYALQEAVLVAYRGARKTGQRVPPWAKRGADALLWVNQHALDDLK